MKLTLLPKDIISLNNEFQSLLSMEGFKFSSQLKLNKNLRALEIPIKLLNENIQKLLKDKTFPTEDGKNGDQFVQDSDLFKEEVELELKEFKYWEIESVKNLRAGQHYTIDKYLIVGEPKEEEEETEEESPLN